VNGIFTISLDFELHWGGFEKWPLSFENEQSRITPKVQLESYKRYFLNTRNVIPKMLELFEKHEIHVTWATVGMLLHQSKEQLIENMPELKPTYLNRELSAYEYIDSKGIGDNEDQDPYHFSPTLVNQILRTPNQELGTHSYSRSNSRAISGGSTGRKTFCGNI
jgi:hypothetical protein